MPAYTVTNKQVLFKPENSHSLSDTNNTIQL